MRLCYSQSAKPEECSCAPLQAARSLGPMPRIGSNRFLVPRLRAAAFLYFPKPALIVFFVVAGLTCPLAAQEGVTLAVTPRALRDGSARYIAHYDPGKMLRLAIALQPPHMAEEEQFLRELQDPASPNFHQYLSHEEWNRRFAPPAQNEQDVVAWAQAQGLRVTQRYANRLIVDVEAPAGVIEKALNVTINTYAVGRRSCYSNDRDPTLPARFSAAVTTILGLNDIDVPHRASRGGSMDDEPQVPDYSPGPAYAVGRLVQGDGGRSKLDQAMARLAQGGGPLDRPTPYGPSDPYGPADLYSSTAYDY